MKILFITEGHYLPQIHGGAQYSTHQLCHGLLARGHEVGVLCSLANRGTFALWSRVKMQLNKRLRGYAITRDHKFGYPVWRTWIPAEAIESLTAQYEPDIFVVLAISPVRMAMMALQTGTPVLVQLQDVEFGQHGGPFETLGNIPCVANSQFTARRYRAAFGVEPTVINPIILKDSYKTRTTRENVTFINPVPQKGSELALRIAALCPDIPFSFVEAWPLSDQSRRELLFQLSSLPNVTLCPSHDDMRKVYGRCKVLLAPSVWEEAYGRVVTEAQINGIPAVASARGGLPEAVGPGGILLDPDAPVDEWVSAIRELWHNEEYYGSLSRAALIHAHRREVDFDGQIDAWELAISAARDPWVGCTNNGAPRCPSCFRHPA